MSFLVLVAFGCVAVTDVLSYHYFRRGYGEVPARGRPAARLVALCWMFGGMGAVILAMASFNAAAYGLTDGETFWLICAALCTFGAACWVGEARYKRERADEPDKASPA